MRNYSFFTIGLALGSVQSSLYTFTVSEGYRDTYTMDTKGTKCIQSPLLPQVINISLRQCSPPAKFLTSTANIADI